MNALHASEQDVQQAMDQFLASNNAAVVAPIASRMDALRAAAIARQRAQAHRPEYQSPEYRARGIQAIQRLNASKKAFDSVWFFGLIIE